MISIFSNHFFNWTEQLRDSGHEVYWLDVFDSNTRVKQIDFVDQIIGWRYKWDYPGRYFVKKKLPVLTNFINIFNERNFQNQLEKEIKRIQPDVVHSFVMYLAGVPALPVMNKFPNLKWIYTAWGSDMYYYQHQPKHLVGMNKTLPRMDYMFADCRRDYSIARELGFRGRFLGVYPGGGGFNFNEFDPFIKEQKNRDILLIKGYQGLHGKCISVLKAFMKLEQNLEDYRIVVFGAGQQVFDFVKNSPLREYKNIEIYEKLAYQNLIELMGQALIYIGNSSSDGMPNTLLEAIIMGVFPIQSNPGGATAEIIEHEKSGLLIEDSEDVKEIVKHISFALKHLDKLQEGIANNNKEIKPKLERDYIKKLVLTQYEKVAKELKKDND